MIARMPLLVLCTAAALPWAGATQAEIMDFTVVTAPRSTLAARVSPSPLLEELGYTGGVAVAEVPGFGASGLMVGYEPMAEPARYGEEANKLLARVLAYVDSTPLLFAGLCHKVWSRAASIPDMASCERLYWKHLDDNWRPVRISMDADLLARAEEADSDAER
ncbi:MAG: hypothetical protein AAGD86_12255, partial [Pseudomonadota bacterium]